MRRPKRSVACIVLRKQLVDGAGREGTHDDDEGFPFVIYIETMLMRHFAPPTTLGTEEWGALWLASHGSWAERYQRQRCRGTQSKLHEVKVSVVSER